MQRQQTALSSSEEDFHRFETKIEQVVSILNKMDSCDKNVQNRGIDLAEKFLSVDSTYQTKLSKDDFIVKIKENRTVINAGQTNSNDQNATDKMVFMEEIERDAARRTKERKERVSIAQNLRKLGNEAFRKSEYEKAISMYSKAIDHIKDSAVLYNNRALTYIRLGLYKKAIIDADFVIQKLDEKNVRSWLYRAQGYYLLGETRDFEKSINEAKKNNPKDLDFIKRTIAHILNKGHSTSSQ